MSAGRILVVDDDSSLRRVMKLQLEEGGYTVSTAGRWCRGVPPPAK